MKIQNCLKKTLQISALFATTMACHASVEKDNSKTKSDPAWLGVATASVDEIVATQLDLPKGVGAAVKLVVPKSPAAKAGIKKHDILFELDGQPVKSPEHLSELISGRSAGQTSELSVIQHGNKKTIAVNFSSRPPHLHSEEEINEQPFGGRIDLGNLGGLKFNFGGDVDIAKQIQQMQKHLQGMFDLEDFNNLPGKAKILESSSKTMLLSDAEGSIEIRKSNGKTKVITKDVNGKITFEGPANTKEEIAKIPEKAKDKLKQFDQSGSNLSLEEFQLGSPGLKVPKLKPGKKVEPNKKLLPPAKKEGKKIQL